MGRVARYKKVKAFDKLTTKSTHSGRADAEYIWGTDVGRKNKKRSWTATNLHNQKVKRKSTHVEDRSDQSGFDCAPENIKDEFDLKDLIGSVQKEKKRKIDDDLKDTTMSQQTSSKSLKASPQDIQATTTVVHDTVRIGRTTIKCTIPSNEEEEKNVIRQLNINTKNGKSLSQAQNKLHRSIQGRKDGESMRAFDKRLKQETRTILAQSVSTLKGSEEKRKRKKEFLKQKKLKNRQGMADSDLAEPLSGSQNAFKSSKSSDVSFLDQVERPPTFSMLPRGAGKRKHDGTERPAENTQESGRETKVKEDRELLNLRDKMRAQYNAIKKKRRAEGHFHL